MSKACQFYRIETRQIASREIRQDRQLPDVYEVRIPWCAHKHTPVSYKDATSVIGGAQLLKCSGDLSKCQVAPSLLSDA